MLRWSQDLQIEWHHVAQLKLPRHVIPKQLASGKIGFFYNTPIKYRRSIATTVFSKGS
jgi:hypothetical protein